MLYDNYTTTHMVFSSFLCRSIQYPWYIQSTRLTKVAEAIRTWPKRGSAIHGPSLLGSLPEPFATVGTLALVKFKRLVKVLYVAFAVQFIRIGYLVNY